MENDEVLTLGIHRSTQIVLLCCFVIFICLPIINMITKWIPEIETQERRALAQWPEFNITTALSGPWRHQVDDYVNDRFGLRNYFIKASSVINLQWFHTSPNNQVLLGKDGWLYYGTQPVIHDYQALNPFTQEQLEQLVTSLESRKNILKERGIEFALLIAPAKYTIYPEYTPSYIRAIGSDRRIDQAFDYIRTHSDIIAIDVREVLKREKNNELLYYKTDTHWNTYGAFIAYQELMKDLSQHMSLLSSIQPLSLDNATVTHSERKGGDLAGLVYAADDMQDTAVELHVSTQLHFNEEKSPYKSFNPAKPTRLFTNSKNLLPRLVFFHDSFANSLLLYTPEHFSRTVSAWYYSLQKDIVDTEKPDIVLLEVTERFLEDLLISKPTE